MPFKLGERRNAMSLKKVRQKRRRHQSNVAIVAVCFSTSHPGHLGTDGAEVARSERLGENTIVDEVKGAPLLSPRSLEVPEDPAIGVLLKDFHLCLDVATGVLLVGRVPLVDELEAGAVSDVRATWVSSVVTSADEVA